MGPNLWQVLHTTQPKVRTRRPVDRSISGPATSAFINKNQQLKRKQAKTGKNRRKPLEGSPEPKVAGSNPANCIHCSQHQPLGGFSITRVAAKRH